MELLPSSSPKSPRIVLIFSELRRDVLNEMSDPRKDSSSAEVLRVYFNKASRTLRETLGGVEELTHIHRLLILAHFAAKSRLVAELEDWSVGSRHPGYSKFEDYLAESEILAHWSWAKTQGQGQ